MEDLKEYKKALGSALRILGRRSHTVKELEIKLLRKGYSKEVVDQVIEYCLKNSYLDDLEFTRQWILGRLRFKPRGKKLIYQELRHKGIDPSIIESILENLISSQEELNLAVELLRKKYSQGDTMDQRKKGQLYRFLGRKGFSSETINKAMSIVLQEETGTNW